jgi:alpha-tubulin suppressor-like RCC1 family protein
MSFPAKLYVATLALVTACEVPFVIQDGAADSGGRSTAGNQAMAGDKATGGGTAGSSAAGSSAMQGGEPSSGGTTAPGSGGDAAGGAGGTPLAPCPDGRGLFALSVSAGEAHACAVQYDTGELYCWGLGQSGQLGNGDTQSSPVPVKVQSDEQFSDVRVNARTTCARGGLGDLYCFGDNFDGQLADETTQGSSLPVLTLNSTSQVAMSAGYVLATTAGGGLFAWGSNTNGQLGLGAAQAGKVIDIETDTGVEDAELVSAGYTHACLIEGASGFGYCAGSNQDSRLGLPGDQRPTFTQISQVPLAQISAGYDRTCAITSQGLLECWGRNFPTTFAGLPEDVTTPRQVGKVESWQRISVGFDHVCGTTTDLAFVCAGDNSQGELGITGASSSTFVAPQPPFRSLNFSAGRDFTCAIREPDFTVVCFGSNEYGQLGRGTSDDSPGAPALVCLPP